MSERILALDYGAKTVGTAVTDDLGLTAVSLETIFRDSEKRLRKTCAAIEKIIRERDVRKIVIGLPLNMDGSEGERAEKVRVFADMIGRRTGLPVFFQDERLTTVEADEIMRERRDKKADRKKKIDSMAAAIILEDYLHSGKKCP